MSRFLIVFSIFLFSTSQASSKVVLYSDTSIYSKINGNRGEGPSQFKGLRNLRPVLGGVLYRSGGNNNYAPFVSRANDSPLSFQTLLNLRESGFRRAYYLYNSKFKESGWGEILPVLHSIGMDYQSLVPKNDSTVSIILSDIYQSIKGNAQGAILVHCWNGWHMSGLISAYSLIQFCDFSVEKAWEYWKICTDGNYSGFSKVKTLITNFKPNPILQITDDEKKTNMSLY